MTTKRKNKTKKAKKKASGVKVHDLGTIKPGFMRYPQYQEKGFSSQLTNHEEGVLTAEEIMGSHGEYNRTSVTLHKDDGTSQVFINNVGEIYSLRSSPNGIITFKNYHSLLDLRVRGGRKRGFSTFDDISNWVPWGPENGIVYSEIVTEGGSSGVFMMGGGTRGTDVGRALTLETILPNGGSDTNVLYTKKSGNFEFDFKTSQGGSAVTRETVGGNNVYKLHRPSKNSRIISESPNEDPSKRWDPCHKGVVVEENKSGDQVLTAHGIWRGKSGVELYRGPVVDNWETYGDNSVMVETSKGRETTVTLHRKDGSELLVYQGPIGKGLQRHPRGLVHRTDKDKVTLYEICGERHTKKPGKFTLPSERPYIRSDHDESTVVSETDYLPGETRELYDERMHHISTGGCGESAISRKEREWRIARDKDHCSWD